MTGNGSRTYAYDAENRMIEYFPGAGALRYTFFYDYLGRCIERKRTATNPSTGQIITQSLENLIYDGTKLIGVTNSQATSLANYYVWQPTSSGDIDILLWDNMYAYTASLNKNIMVRTYWNEWEGRVYTEITGDYLPFGENAPGVAGDNRFNFSSEEYVASTGLYHYLFRNYNAGHKRFTTRDPIEENGGVNLYAFVGNNPINRWDDWGFTDDECGYPRILDNLHRCKTTCKLEHERVVL